VGTGEEWKKYRQEFNSIVAEDSVPDRGALDHFFQRLDQNGSPVADHNGALWMEFSDRNESSRVGLSASNIFSSTSDLELAHQLLLARIGRVLKSPKHSRENMVEFKSDWNLLQSVPVYRATYSANSAVSPAPLGTGHGGNMLLTRSLD